MLEEPIFENIKDNNEDIGNKEYFLEDEENHPLLPNGWLCPRCLKVNSPLKYECDC